MVAEHDAARSCLEGNKNASQTGVAKILLEDLPGKEVCAGMQPCNAQIFDLFQPAALDPV